MKFISNKVIRIILVSALFCIISIQINILAATPQITVDVSKVISDVSNNPVGINLNFLLDREAVAIPSQELNLGSLRYPMGEIADYYLFDRDNPRQPKISVRDPSVAFFQFTDADGAWKNPLDFDRFVRICRSVGAEPFIVIGIDAIAYTQNSPHATPEEVLQAAVDWVEYANITQGYNIKYWEIGNENDLPDIHWDWTAEKYARTVVQFAQEMKKVDPSIQIGVNGMTDSTWWDGVMPIVKDDVDFLITHQYSSMGNYQQWNSNNWNHTSNIEDANQAIEQYNPNLRLNITEYSSFKPGDTNKNNAWKMLHNFEMLGNILLFDKIDYSHFWISRWFTPNPLKTNASMFNGNYEFTPMAYSLNIWGNFLKKQMVDTSKVNNIRAWASYDPDDESLNVFLLNKDLQNNSISILLNNYNHFYNNSRWILNAPDPDSTEVTWEQVAPLKVNGSEITTNLESLSVTVITLKKFF